jgi:prepilin-type N-terminal cleavage/methylation domain-containing protein
MTIRNTRTAGFTLVEIMIVVAIIGLLAAVAIPYFVRARTTSQANTCINNLRQIEAAVQQWALEQKQAPNASVTLTDVTPYIRLDSNGNLPACPANGTYSVTTVDELPTCSRSGDVPPHALQ